MSHPSHQSSIQSSHYLADRSQRFTNFIRSTLSNANLKPHYISLLINEENIQKYGDAFTSKTVDPQHNYEFYEQLGDVVAGQFLVHYFYRRFPKLKCDEGVKIVARLKINYGSKQCFADIAHQLGFWPFISAANETRRNKRDSLLEDVFEAFLGVTCDILDSVWIDKIQTVGVGYAICYNILKGVFDDMDISLRYEDLYDPKTRLKELFDCHRTSLGEVKYDKNPEKKEGLNYMNVYSFVGGVRRRIGFGRGSTKVKSEHNAARAALEEMKKRGYNRVIPSIYRRLIGDEVKKEVVSPNLLRERYRTTITDDEGKERVEEFGINNMYYTKKHNKRQGSYQSTVLALYCRERNIQAVKVCLELGADANVLDTDGLGCLDVLFMNRDIDEDLVEGMVRMLMVAGAKVEMNKQVYDYYFTRYKSPFFSSLTVRMRSEEE